MSLNPPSRFPIKYKYVASNMEEKGHFLQSSVLACSFSDKSSWLPAADPPYCRLLHSVCNFQSLPCLLYSSSRTVTAVPMLWIAYEEYSACSGPVRHSCISRPEGPTASLSGTNSYRSYRIVASFLSIIRWFLCRPLKPLFSIILNFSTAVALRITVRLGVTWPTKLVVNASIFCPWV